MPENPSGHARARHPYDLNRATEQELAQIPEIGPERAATIVRLRPFESWEQLRRTHGFDDRLVEQLRSAGFSITRD